MTNLSYNEMTDEDLVEEFKWLGSKISYHYADDSCREWDLIPPLKKEFYAIEEVLKSRGISVDKSGWLL